MYSDFLSSAPTLKDLEMERRLRDLSNKRAYRLQARPYPLHYLLTASVQAILLLYTLAVELEVLFRIRYNSDIEKAASATKMAILVMSAPMGRTMPAADWNAVCTQTMIPTIEHTKSKMTSSSYPKGFLFRSNFTVAKQAGAMMPISNT